VWGTVYPSFAPRQLSFLNEQFVAITDGTIPVTRTSGKFLLARLVGMTI